jgi:hypothetical protein
MNINYFDLLDLLDDDFDDNDHIDTIFLGFPSPLPQDHEDHDQYLALCVEAI